MYAASEGLTSMARAAVSCRHLFTPDDDAVFMFTMRCFKNRRLRFAEGPFGRIDPLCCDQLESPSHSPIQSISIALFHNVQK